jgi:hypothetical protein
MAMLLNRSRELTLPSKLGVESHLCSGETTGQMSGWMENIRESLISPIPKPA